MATLEIIGAGLGRTGTRSLKDALSLLGWPCLHMMDMFELRERVEHWEDAAAGRRVDWTALFAGFSATVDYPACLYWRELMRAYPQAKVVLTLRPTDEWYASSMRTIYAVGRARRARGELGSRLAQYMGSAIWAGQFGGRFEDESYAKQVYEAHNQAVREGVPSDRLIVCELGSGWRPLCEGLGVDVPEADYPHRNTRGQFIERMRRP